MITNSRNLFFVRKIQINFYFKKNIVIHSLFFMEYMLFKTYAVKNELFLANIKLKWLFDQVSNPKKIDKPLYALKPLIENQKIKKYLLNMLQDFSKIIDSSEKKNFLKNFKNFNYNFNKIITLLDENFLTSYRFQIFQFLYVSKINEIKKYEQLFFNQEKKVDITESVFTEIFLKKCNPYINKISKFQYLYYLLKGLIKK